MKHLYTFLILLALTGQLWAAEQSSVLRGFVVNPASAGVAGAAIVVKSGDEVKARVETSAQGEYQIALDPGRYRLEITAAGFEKEIHTVNLTPNLKSLTLALKAQQPSPDEIQEMADNDQELQQYLRGLMEPAVDTSTRNDDVVIDLLMADAESTTLPAAIRGTVYDDELSRIIGATVVIKTAEQIVAEAQTGTDGTFNVPLRAGQYTVEVSVAGFAKAAQTINLTPDLAPLSFSMRDR